MVLSKEEKLNRFESCFKSCLIKSAPSLDDANVFLNVFNKNYGLKSSFSEEEVLVLCKRTCLKKKHSKLEAYHAFRKFSKEEVTRQFDTKNVNEINKHVSSIWAAISEEAKEVWFASFLQLTSEEEVGGDVSEEVDKWRHAIRTAIQFLKEKENGS